MTEVSVILADGKTVSAKCGTVEEILEGLNLNPYEYLAVRNGELLTADDLCNTGDVLKLTSIVHGG